MDGRPDLIACPRCGQENPAESNFCAVCGEDLAREQAADGAATAAHDVVQAPPGEDAGMLVVVRGANAGSRFALGGAVTTIGRHPDSAVFLDDVTVSRRHAEVRNGPGGVEILDAGSLNGTYVNGQRIERAALREGDQLQIGKYKLVYVVEPADGQ